MMMMMINVQIVMAMIIDDGNHYELATMLIDVIKMVVVMVMTVVMIILFTMIIIIITILFC